MPLPPDHARQTLRRLSVRERWLVRIMAAVTAVIVIGVVIALVAGGQSSSDGSGHLPRAGGRRAGQSVRIRRS